MHLYIHVPFCSRRCSYCDFAIAVRQTVPSSAYLSAVLREWELWQREPVWDESRAVETIYFGGGTPSRLDPQAIAALLEAISRVRKVVPGAEITLEANPEDVTLAAAQAWKSAGVNRLSLGAQSLDPRVLAWMHRTHTEAEVPLAVERIRRAGIHNLSLDLIFGLPPELSRDWSMDLNSILGLAPDHLSLYGLTIEPHTPLARWTERGQIRPVQDDRYAAEFLEAHAALVPAGFEHYEVSNAAKPGFRARHNGAYWRRAPFIGLGPSAHSGFGRERRWNVRHWANYERVLREGGNPMESRELLDDSEIALEKLYLGLRTIEGAKRELLAPQESAAWVRAGWATLSPGRIVLTPEGWLRLDGLVRSATLVGA